MIALCTIVKDEEKIIERMLKSTEGFVDAYYILDTGSSDKTPEIIERWLETHKGKLGRSEFKGFATSRNEALDMVPEDYEYTLIIDADEVLVRYEKDLITDLDQYGVYVKANEYAVLGSRIAKRTLRWEREIHNELVGAKTMEILPPEKILIEHIHDGRRAYDPNKLPGDLKKLSTGEPTDTFYLGMTHYGMGNRRDAARAFKKAANSSGRTEIIYMAHFMIGKINYDAGFFAEAFFEFMDAYSVNRTIEASFFIIKIAQLYGREKLVLRQLYATRPGVMATYIIPDIREFLFDKVFADIVSSVDKEKAIQVYEKILKKDIPKGIRDEVEKNIVTLS